MALRLPFGVTLSRTPAGAHRRANGGQRLRRSHERSIELAAAEVSDLVADWLTGTVPIGEILRRHLSITRARSREQRRNNPYWAGFASRTPRQVLGPTGIGIEWRIVDEAGELDERLNTAIEEKFRDWSETKACDVQGRLDFAQVQELALKTMIVDGEHLLRMLVGEEYGPYCFGLQFIDPAQLDVAYDEDRANGQRVRHGIQFDPLFRRVGYWFDEAADRFGYPVGRERLFVPAREIVHAYIQDEVGQWRGIPWGVAILIRLLMMGKYQEAALVAARSGAAKGGYFERDSEDNNDDGPLPGDSKDDDGNWVEDIEPGVSRALPPGWKWHGNDPTYPHGEFAPFVKAMLYGAAVGVQSSYGSFAGDMSDGNFAAQRLAKNDDWEQLECVQHATIADTLRPIVNRWSEVQLLIGSISIQGRPLTPDLLPMMRRWQAMPKGWDYVNPVDDVQADGMRTGWAFDSHSSIVRKRTGRDFRTLVQEIKRDRQILKAAGIELAEFTRPDPTKVVVQEN